MKTVNSLSGGKTSSYIAKHYSADYNVFALVTTSNTNCIFPDQKIRQIVSDRIGREFIGTLEEDAIIYTMLDLEQFVDQENNAGYGQRTFKINITYEDIRKSLKQMVLFEDDFTDCDSGYCGL